MAYLGVLPEAPSFSTQLARGLGSGIGTGLNQGISVAEKLGGTRLRQTAARDKLASRVWEKTPRYLKAYHPSLSGNPRAEQEIADFAASILRSDPKISEDEAFSLAAETYKKSRKSVPEEDEGYFEKRRRLQESGAGQGLIQSIRESLNPAISAAKKNPSLLASELPSAVGKLEEGLTSANDPFGSAMGLLGRRLLGTQGTPATPERMIAAHFRKDVPEEQKEGAEQIGDIESVLLGLALPVPGLKGRLGRTLPKAATKEASIGKKVAEETIPGVKEVTKPLQGRVAKEAPVSATESRLERMSPKQRLFETKQQEKVLESQLKQYPKYAEDISKDAAEMAARREKILGPKALETKAQKIEYYSKQLPAVQKDYEKAISRVRALEDQMVKQPELAEKIKPLIQAATKQLEESQFLLKQTLNNAKTGSSKVGIEAMREAAQKKVLDISEKIGAGEEILLKKADYNPEFIRQAKQLEKKKPIPSTHVDDYFTQVHDGYAKVYKDRIAQLNQEISKLAENRTLSSLHSRQQLNKERQQLQKLVDHVDAENAIHRHKLALRQVHERKLAQERLGNFKPIEGKPKVSQTAKPQIKEMGRIAESMKTSEGRAKLADDFVENVSSKKGSENLSKDKKSVKEALEEVNKYSQEAKDGFKSIPGAKNEKEAVRKSINIVHRIREQMDKLLSKVPILGSSSAGRDFMVGVISSLLSEFIKENNIPIGVSTTASVFLGKRGGAGTRVIGNTLGKWAIKAWKIENAKSAYRKEDDDLIVKYKKKYGNKILKEAREDLYGT